MQKIEKIKYLVVDDKSQSFEIDKIIVRAIVGWMEIFRGRLSRQQSRSGSLIFAAQSTCSTICPIPPYYFFFFFFSTLIFNHILFNELDNKSLSHSYRIKNDAQRIDTNDGKKQAGKEASSRWTSLNRFYLKSAANRWNSFTHFNRCIHTNVCCSF